MLSFSTAIRKQLNWEKATKGTSLKAGDSIVIYSTLPFGKVIGKVRVIKRELLTVDRLWEQSQHGRLAKVSRSQFDAYYASQISGVGVWVSSVALFPSPIARGPTSPELGSSLAATAADSTINRRSDGSTLTSPTKLTERDCVRGDLTETNELRMGREWWQITNLILNLSRANIIIKMVEKKKIYNLPLLVSAGKRKSFSTRKK